MTAGRPGEASHAAIAAMIEERFPQTMCWWGQYTRRWWALVPYGRGTRLVEARSPEDLCHAIVAVHPQRR